MDTGKIRNMVDAMSFEEKLTLMHGKLGDPYGANQAGHVPGIKRLGIPDIFLCDGESGVDVLWEATAFPAKVALAATFDTASAEEYGEALGLETRAAGMHVILSSRVNIARDPLAQIGESNGGNFQTLGEDPVLNGRMARAEVKGVEKDHNAIANLKQFFGSSTGTSQGAENSVIDEQTMFDVYLWPFEMVIRSGVGSLMTNYNQVNGKWTYRWSEILDGVLRRQWGFNGIVVNDWCCLYSPRAVKGGVTLEMPEDYAYGKRLAEALDNGDVTMEEIDRCVTAYLQTLERFSMLHEARIPGPIGVEIEQKHIPIARKLAARSAVLLKNDGVLPLNAEKEKIAMIGPGAAAVAMPVFKEAAYGFSDRKQSPLHAIRELTGRDIPFAEGTDMEGELIPAASLSRLMCYRTRYESDPMEKRDLGRLPPPMAGESPTEIEAIDFQGEKALTPLTEPDEYYLFQGTLTPKETGWHRLSLQTAIPDLEAHARNHITNKEMFCFTSGNLYLLQDGQYRCIGIGTRTAMNGGIVANSDVVPCHDGWNNAAGFIWLEAGVPYEIAATATNLYHDPVEVRLCWSTPSKRKAMRDQAIALAASVDVPVVFAWHKSPSSKLELHEEQNELIEDVAMANPRTVVVINSGDPVAMPWLDKVSAVLEMWFPGQEGGYATADVLLGFEDAGGRLPVTFPVRAEDTAPHAPGYPERCAPCGKVPRDDRIAERSAVFSEGVNVGYRWLNREKIKPLFPFGHGLSYTNFQLSLLEMVKTSEGGVKLLCSVRNCGSRNGICVVQCYLGAPQNVPEGVQVASKALAAFTSVELDEGEERRVEMGIDPESFTYWDVNEHCRKRLQGERPLWLGFSSENLPISRMICFP
ncbi:MAG: glycoside hydrolase family 3 C-terminal domain-containing protein [Eubacteriales bacterium]|nr:glycoside hydrolase family 3 C-terminal domain-containing protein [Eubacteriales bacterium]